MATKAEHHEQSEYPEHNALRAVKDQCQAIGGFLEWLEEERYFICSYHEDSSYPVRAHNSIEGWLAKHFGIDRDKLESEKLRMLDVLRKANMKREANRGNKS